MYDERTRQQDHYWASLAYAQEEARSKGHAEGHAAGRAEERLDILVTLLKDGYISPKVAAEKLNISVDELDKYL